MTEECVDYDPWGGESLDSATGKAFQVALKDLAHVYGKDWPRVCAAIIAGTIRDRDQTIEVANHLQRMATGGY